MRSILLLVLLLGSSLAHALIIGVEQFDYLDGPAAIEDGGVFWDHDNVTPTRTGTPSAFQNASGSPRVGSGQLITEGNGISRAYNGADEGRGAINDSNVFKAVYYRVTLTTGGTLPEFFGISASSADGEVVFFGKKPEQEAFCIERAGASQVLTTTSVQTNTTYTIVARIDYESDIVKLFINPDLNAAEPVSADAEDIFDTTASTTGLSLSSGSGTAPIFWDDLVVATNWGDLGTVVTTTTDENNGSLNPALGNGISLREALLHSPTGSLVTFAPSLSGETISINLGELSVPFSSPFTLILDASKLPEPVTIAGTISRLFTIPTAATVTMHSLNIINGRASGEGGGIQNFGNVTLMSCTLNGNWADGSGGAIVNVNSGTCTVLSSTLSNNKALAGGAISNFGNCVVQTSTLSGNQVETGSGGGISNSGTCTLSSSTLSANSSGNSGGGIFNSGNFNLTSSIVAGNIAPTGANIVGSTSGSNNLIDGDPKLTPLGYYGGPVDTMHPLIGSPAIDSGGSVDPGGTDARGYPRFVDGDGSNGAQLDIGAVEAGPLLFVTSSSDGIGIPGTLRDRIGNEMTPPGSRIGFASENFPAEPITLTQGELSIPDTFPRFIDASNLSAPVTISGGNASRVFNIPAAATVVLHSLRIENGRSTADGGGIINSGICTVISSTISGNSARRGGGIHNSGTCNLFSSTLSANSTQMNGGGFFNTGTCTVRSSTFSGNSTQSSGGGLVNSGNATVSSSTFSGNSARSSAGGTGISSSGSLDLTFSIVAGNAPQSSANVTGVTFENKNLINVDPKLTPLGDNGGPTQTMALLPDSPAIAGAINGTRASDQRGFPIVAVADIGAVEYQENADLRRFWPLDLDNDGSPFGVEFALGTNPFLSDSTNPANLRMTADTHGHPVLTFGRNSAANSFATWRLIRSTTLLPDSFTEIFRFTGPTGDTSTDGSSANVNADHFEVTDNNPPPGRAFYRVEAISP